jgi:myosin heavy subunit
VEGIDDRTDWLDMLEANAKLGMDDGELNELFRVVAGVLHLGTITLSPLHEGESSEVRVISLIVKYY